MTNGFLADNDSRFYFLSLESTKLKPFNLYNFTGTDEAGKIFLKGVKLIAKIPNHFCSLELFKRAYPQIMADSLQEKTRGEREKSAKMQPIPFSTLQYHLSNQHEAMAYEGTNVYLHSSERHHWIQTLPRSQWDPDVTFKSLSTISLSSHKNLIGVQIGISINLHVFAITILD